MIFVQQFSDMMPAGQVEERTLKKMVFIVFYCFYEMRNINQNVCLEVHKFFISLHLMIVMRSNGSWQTFISTISSIIGVIFLSSVSTRLSLYLMVSPDFAKLLEMRVLY